MKYIISFILVLFSFNITYAEELPWYKDKYWEVIKNTNGYCIGITTYVDNQAMFISRHPEGWSIFSTGSDIKKNFYTLVNVLDDNERVYTTTARGIGNNVVVLDNVNHDFMKMLIKSNSIKISNMIRRDITGFYEAYININSCYRSFNEREL